ncbi:MAG: O-antigen ligase family protein, partial [Chloroflexi bacterium]|nr:O-antigen ligase family protein [Chloroflexota bacterium]
MGGLAALAVAAVIGVAAGLPGEVNDRWQEFKAPSGVIAPGKEDDVFSRLQAVNGNSRYQYWQSTLDAAATDPLKGIGPGTFEFWWSRNSTDPAFIRDAHTLYFETLGEMGIIGLALLGGMLLWVLGTALTRSLRAPPGLRLWIAAATGGVAAFMTAAAFEWVWE